MPGRRVEPEPEAEQADHVPTDTKDMTYFWSNSGQHIQQFMKGFKENNGNDAVHHHSEQRLQAVRCAALLFSPHTSRGPFFSRARRVVTADTLRARDVQAIETNKCSILFSLWRTDKAFHTIAVAGQRRIFIDDIRMAGTRVISLLVATSNGELLVNFTVPARRDDGFASEAMNVFKTAINMPLRVDAPPCRARRPRTRLALHSLCPLRRSRAAHAPPTSRSQ